MDFLNINRPGNTQKPASGKLLVAEPFLRDPNFVRSVVLLCEHGVEGTVGFVLNNITDMTLGDLLPEIYTPSLEIWQGGPVQTDTLHMLHRIPAILGGNDIGGGIYWGGSYEALQAMISNGNYDPADLRLYVGYSGWSPGQLEQEMKDESWLVANATQQLLFDTAPKNVWKEAVSSLGREYKYLLNMPVDPQLN